MSYKPKFLGHVNIFVRNVDRSRGWYEDVLGLHTYDVRSDKAAFMTADMEQSHEIALMEVGESAPGPQMGQVGLNHMAWMMDSVEDLKELYNRLVAKKVPIERVVDHGVSIGLYLRDPDGNGVEVSYEMPRSEWPRRDAIFTATTLGQFPGPWDEELAEQRAASR